MDGRRVHNDVNSQRRRVRGRSPTLTWRCKNGSHGYAAERGMGIEEDSNIDLNVYGCNLSARALADVIADRVGR